jgi:hypothetical protein
VIEIVRLHEAGVGVKEIALNRTGSCRGSALTRPALASLAGERTLPRSRSA